MATIPQNQNLCDYCHQKPKFGNHNYCGKTCSQQAAAMNQTNAAAHSQPQTGFALCKQCNQKPKFQNFDFCGKNCASTWQLAHGGSGGSSNPPMKKSAGNAGGQVMPNMQIPSQLLGKIPQPLQAQLQAVLPAVTAALQQQGHNQPQQQQQPPASVNLNVNNVAPVPPSNAPQQSTVATTLTPNNQNANPPQQKTNVNLNLNGVSGPGLPVPQNAQGPTNGVNNNVVPASVQGQVQATIPATCRLTGCGKPVYTDATHNHASEYCSKRHREEAVITGQVKACIMCLKMPRSSTDHFCSKGCREAALSQ